MKNMTAFYFAASLLFALISIPTAMAADSFKKDMGALLLAIMSAMLLFQGLKNL